MPHDNRPLEIEQKFVVGSFDAVRLRLTELRAAEQGTSRERDTYFRHPVRDFAVTDEAFRLRTATDDAGRQRHAFTYKGPRSAGSVKTRSEIEFPVGDDATSRDEIVALVEALSFEPVADVDKTRVAFQLEFDGHPVHVTLDNVAGLPNHVEVEILSTDQDRGEKVVQVVAKKLELTTPEPRSYLEMTLGSTE